MLGRPKRGTRKAPWRSLALLLACVAAPGRADGFAFGIERLNQQFVRFELGDPEVMTVLGPSGASAAVNACEFVEGEGFERLVCLDTEIPANLFALDTRSGTRSDLGQVATGPSTFVVGLAVDPTSATLYALVCAAFGGGSLHTLDLGTETLALVAPLTGSGCIVAGGFDSSGAMFGLDSAENELVSIDKVTGVVTPIGPIGFDSNFPPAIDFDSDDGCHLFSDNVATGVGELRSCDTTSGGTTFIGNFGSASPGEFGSVSAAAIHPGGLFADGFELADSSRWSSVSPLR